MDLTGPIKGAESSEVGGVRMDTISVGGGRVKRLIYPAGFRWSEDMKPLVSTDRCMHAHIGFLAQGAIAGEYPDGCTFEYTAPAMVAIEPGHDAWVVGDKDAVLVQFDAAEGTTEFFGVPPEHAH
jgi:hypothetical protein